MSHEFHWQLLQAGAFRLDGGSMFGVVPKAIWHKLAPPDDRNRIKLQTNCLLLDDGSNKILIETGYGDKWSDKDRDIFALQQRTIVDALCEIDVEPADIDHVIVSHLHFDHAGALTRYDNNDHVVPTFPKAQIHVQQREWEDALANKSTMTKTYLRSHLDPIADRVKCMDGEGEILPGISSLPMPGHTWGQHAIVFNDFDGVMCFPGDVMPTVNHIGAAFSMGYDMEPYTNMQSKLKLLERAADEHWRLVLDHEPDTPIVYVERDADRPGSYRLLPV